MNPDYVKNFTFSEDNMQYIKNILKSNAMYIIDIEVATPEDDMKHSTDLKIKVSSGDIAVRIRRPGYTVFHDLTIRAYSNGYDTEIHKLRKGFADWYLYAWTDNNNKICDWWLIDIRIMRNSGLLSESRKIKMNKDGRTGFISYSLAELISCGALVSRHN